MSARLQRLLEEAVASGVFPQARAVVLFEGRRIFEGGAQATPGTVFDLASLTKVMATTSCFLSLWAEGKLSPETELEGYRLEDLLFHRSGLPAFLPFFARVMPLYPRLFEASCPAILREEVRRQVVQAAFQLPASASSRAVYSDVGFLILGELLARAASLPLDALYQERVAHPLGLSARFRRLSACLPALPELAPTGATRPREPAPGQEGLWSLAPHPSPPGEVDDDNAWVMDGVAGHAGLFGTAAEVAAFGQAVLEGFFRGNALAPKELWQRALRPDQRTPGSERALGFDTPREQGSSAGRHLGRLPPGAVGHLGSTGTSLWVDLARGLVVALLSNRVQLGRSNLRLQAFRPAFHDAVLEELGLTKSTPMASDENGKVLERIEPSSVRRIHLLGVAGTGMGSFAGMLKAAGYQVTGSDQNIYPPMSEMLKAWGIPTYSPYATSNLDQAQPELVIIGNVIRRVNPEAAETRARRLPQMSFPAALGSFFLQGRHSVVVAGTHGKTTTSALMGHVLVEAGRDPSFLVGGVTRNYSANFRLGRGEHFVVEGDEYDTAYFDKGPKFLHYQPRTLILTSLELDHADIYRDLTHYESSFEQLVGLLPEEGTIAVSAAYPRAVEICRASGAEVITYRAEEGAEADFRPHALRLGEEGARFAVLERGLSLGEVLLPLGGAHNVENALGVIAASRSLGLSFEEIRRGLSSFLGVRRRQEVRGEPGGVLVVDDFAHHPTAVRETIAAIRRRYPSRRLWAVFEPRSNTSRRNLHQQEYARSFTGAALVRLRVPEKHDRVPEGEELDLELLVQALRGQGMDAQAEKDVEALAGGVASGAVAGDVILVMSNGSFGGFLELLLAQLEARRG